MFQVSRDADQAIRGLRVNHSAGQLQDDCCSLGMLPPAGGRPCRGLQDRQTRARGLTDRVSREAQRGRRDEPVSPSNKSSQWSLGDSLATGANSQATFGDTRRQLLGLQVGAGGSALPGRRWSALRCDLLESKRTERFMATGGQSAAIETRVRARVESRSATRKPSETTTNNDNMKNQQDIQIFWTGPSGWLIDSPAECRRDSVVARTFCGLENSTQPPIFTLINSLDLDPRHSRPRPLRYPAHGQSCNILMSTHKMRLIFKSFSAGGCPFTVRTWIRLR